MAMPAPTQTTTALRVTVPLRQIVGAAPVVGPWARSWALGIRVGGWLLSTAVVAGGLLMLGGLLSGDRGGGDVWLGRPAGVAVSAVPVGGTGGPVPSPEGQIRPATDPTGSVAVSVGGDPPGSQSPVGATATGQPTSGPSGRESSGPGPSGPSGPSGSSGPGTAGATPSGPQSANSGPGSANSGPGSPNSGPSPDEPSGKASSVDDPSSSSGPGPSTSGSNGSDDSGGHRSGH